MGDAPWADNVKRIEEWLRRHPGATWHAPGRDGDGTLFGEHKVTWTQASADPAHDGVTRSDSHHDLGRLCNYLEALERAEMGVSPR